MEIHCFSAKFSKLNISPENGVDLFYAVSTTRGLGTHTHLNSLPSFLQFYPAYIWDISQSPKNMLR